MSRPILDPLDVGARWYQDPNEVIYSLAYIHGQQKLGMDHAEANEYGKREVVYDKAVRRAVRTGLSGKEAMEFAENEAMNAKVSGAEPETAGNRQMAATRLSTPFASPLPTWSTVAAPPIPTGDTAEAYDQLRLALESRRNGRFASPTKVSNPEVVAAALVPRAMDLPATGPSMPSGQMDLLQLLERAQVPDELPAAAPTTGELPQRTYAVDPMAERTRSGKRLAGGYAVTGGLGLLGLLGLAALTDPYEA